MDNEYNDEEKLEEEEETNSQLRENDFAQSLIPDDQQPEMIVPYLPPSGQEVVLGPPVPPHSMIPSGFI